MKRLILIVSSGLLMAAGFAQGTWVMSNMDWISSATEEFPQCRPIGRGYVSLPGANVHYASNWLQPAQWLQTEAQQTTLNLVALQSSLQDENKLESSLHLPILGFGMAFGKHAGYFLNFQVEERIQFAATLPGDVLRLPLEGNLGLGTVNGDALSLDFSHHRNVRIGIQGNAGERWAWGLRYRQLKGFERATLRDVRLHWETDPETAEWSLEAGGVIQTSGLASLLDSTGSMAFPAQGWSTYLTSPGSKGWGLDVGVRFLPNEHWSLDASWSGFGRMFWEHDLMGMQWNPDPIAFQGVDVLDGVLGPQVASDSVRDWLNRWSETLEHSATIEQLDAAFLQHMPGTWAMRGQRDLGDRANIQATLRRSSSGAWSLSSGTTVQLGRLAQLNATYTVGSSLRALGTGAAFRAGPMVFFAAIDNVLAARYVEVTWGENQRAWLPWDASILQARMGLNWTIGRPKKPSEAPAVPLSVPSTRTPDWHAERNVAGSVMGQ